MFLRFEQFLDVAQTSAHQSSARDRLHGHCQRGGWCEAGDYCCGPGIVTSRMANTAVIASLHFEVEGGSDETLPPNESTVDAGYNIPPLRVSFVLESGKRVSYSEIMVAQETRDHEHADANEGGVQRRQGRVGTRGQKRRADGNSAADDSGAAEDADSPDVAVDIASECVEVHLKRVGGGAQDKFTLKHNGSGLYQFADHEGNPEIIRKVAGMS